VKRRQVILAGAAVTAGLAIGRGTRADTPTIRIANLDIGPFAPVAYVGRLADRYGIKVHVTGFRTGLQSAQAVSGGAADIGVGGVEAAVTTIAGGTPASIIAGCTTGGLGWMARKDSGIKTVADLKGKKFGVIRGLHELVMKAEFDKFGLTSSQDPGSDVQVFYINAPPAVPVALRNGDIDAGSAPEPFPTLAEQAGYAVRLPPPYDTPLLNLPRALFASRDFLTTYPDAAARFVTAYVAAMKTFRDEPKLAEDFALNDALKGAMTANDWQLSLPNQGWDVSLAVPTVQAYIDLENKYGLIRKPMKAETITDLAMLDKAKATVGW
jgi:NitT/TauT family transport system substrate-binding protein